MILSKCCNALPIGEPDTETDFDGMIKYAGNCSKCGDLTDFYCDHENIEHEPADKDSGIMRDAHICVDCGVEVPEPDPPFQEL